MSGEKVGGRAEQPAQLPMWPLPDRHRIYFLVSGMLFLMTALALFLLTGYMVFQLSGKGPIIEIPSHSTSSSPVAPSASAVSPGTLTQKDVYNFFGRILSFALAPLVSLAAAIICAVVGTRLLRASGAVSTQVIAPQDYAILGPAISAGNEQAVTQFIRLSSLSGLTGTFTKIGLTGLPLATISLTVLLGLAGLANAQFFDLAKLTLGAFLGSFVQRQAEPSGRGAHEQKS